MAAALAVRAPAHRGNVRGEIQIERSRKSDAGAESASPQRATQGGFTANPRAGAFEAGINNSPRMVAQRRMLESLFGAPVHDSQSVSHDAAATGPAVAQTTGSQETGPDATARSTARSILRNVVQRVPVDPATIQVGNVVRWKNITGGAFKSELVFGVPNATVTQKRRYLQISQSYMEQAQLVVTASAQGGNHVANSGGQFYICVTYTSSDEPIEFFALSTALDA